LCRTNRYLQHIEKLFPCFFSIDMNSILLHVKFKGELFISVLRKRATLYQKRGKFKKKNSQRQTEFENLRVNLTKKWRKEEILAPGLSLSLFSFSHHVII
jgi:hypothetical protein